MKIYIDQRIELITIIQTLCGYWDNLAQIYDNQKLFQCKYKDNINNYFEKYKQHETIELYKKLCNDVQDICTFLTLILNHSDLPDLSRIKDNNENNYERFIDSIRKFYQETNFCKFFENNKNTYGKIIFDFGNKDYLENEINSIFEYLDIDNKNYKVIISPLVMGNFGININTDNYIIISPYDYKDNKYIFGSKESIKNTIWHEIGHTVINYLTKKYYKQSKNIEIPEKFIKMFYNNMEAIINEYIIRSITYLLEKDNNYKKTLLEYEIKKGFDEIENISNYISENNMENNKFNKGNKYEILIEYVIEKICKSYCA